MYLIDVRLRNRELLQLAREARDKGSIQIADFYRLAFINALAIERTPIKRKVEHFSTDMDMIMYVNDEIMKLADGDISDKDFRQICVLIGVAGDKIRRNLPYITPDELDYRKVRVAPDFLRGLIYAQ